MKLKVRWNRNVRFWISVGLLFLFAGYSAFSLIRAHFHIDQNKLPQYDFYKKIPSIRGGIYCSPTGRDPYPIMKFQIEVIKSKLHRVTVTQANLNYVGSITIDEALMEAANLIEGEKVQILDINNGERFETYIIKGERGSGCICLNGAAARKVQVGDIIIIMSYALMDFEEAKTFQPKVVFPDQNTNKLL